MIRYRYIEKQILELLYIIKESNPNLLTFPLNMEKIIRNFPNYRIWSYEKYSQYAKIPLSDVALYFQSDSGCTLFNTNDDTYFILFNQNHVIGRQRFTIAHELGHCILYHFRESSICRTAKDEPDLYVNKTIEREADYFAATLLCPLPVCKKLKISSALDIQHMFGLSCEASLYQYKRYLVWKNQHYKNAFDIDITNIMM